MRGNSAKGCVNIGSISLTFVANIGKIYIMVNVFSILLRFVFVLSLWGFVWHFIDGQSQSRRILRAAVLVLVFLVTLALVRLTGL